MKPDSKIQKIFKKVRIEEQGNDFKYWQTQPYETRLETLEKIRQEYHLWKYGTEPGLQRVYKIVKRG